MLGNINGVFLMMIFHVIGLHAAGKSTFIKNKFPNAIVFDMKKFYLTHDFLSASIYDRTAHTIDNEFYEALEEAKRTNKILIVESSGINPKVNRLVQQYNHITILVVTPLDIVNKRMEEEDLEFDPKALNDSILEHLENGRIEFDTKYFTQLDMFYPDLKIDKFLKLDLPK